MDWEMSFKHIRLGRELVLERVKTGHIYLERFYPNGTKWLTYKFDSFDEEVYKSMPDELRPVINRAQKEDLIKGISDATIVGLDLQASLCNAVVDKFRSLLEHKDLTGEGQDLLLVAATQISDDYWNGINATLKYDENIAEQRIQDYQAQLEEKRQALLNVKKEIEELKKTQSDVDKQLEAKIKQRWDLEEELDRVKKS